MAASRSAVAFDEALEDKEIRKRIVQLFDRATIIKYRRGDRIPDIKSAAAIAAIIPACEVTGWLPAEKRRSRKAA